MMIRGIWRKLGLLVVLMALVAVGGAASAQPATAPDRVDRFERVISQEVSLAEQMAAEALLTEEVMLGAEPLPMPALEEGALASMEFEAVPGGPMEFIPGGLSEEDKATFAQEMLEADAAVSLVGPMLPEWGYSYPPPYTRYYANRYSQMWKAYPWKTMGKLYFQKPGSSSWYYCTASVMYGRALWTAGHCVYTKGKGWHKNMSFVPAYRSGSAPYGTWTVYTKATLSGWTKGKYAYDIAAAAVRDQGGKKISQKVGYLGAMWNASSIQHFHAFGLPSNISSGKYLTCCAASTSRRDAQSGPDPLGIGCDMLHGSSGGPRLVTYKPYASGANNYVNGVNSYYYTSKPKQVYAAYFGNGAKNLYNWGKSK